MKNINEGIQVDIDKAIQIEEKLFGECFETSEQVEGMKNFLEKGKKKHEKKKNLKVEDKKENDNKNQEFTKYPLVPTDKFKGMKLLDEFTTLKMPAIVSAGDKNSHNSCVIGWGLLGVAWSKPLFIVYVKPDKYTYQFMEKTTYFTVNFIKKELYKKFRIYGNKSGRDVDKENESIEFIFNF